MKKAVEANFYLFAFSAVSDITSLADETKEKQYENWKPDDDEKNRKLIFDKLFTGVMIPYRQQYEQVWQDAYDIHDQISDSEFDDGRTNIVLPLSTMLIETKLSEELENRPDIYFEAQAEDDVPKVPILEDVIKRHVWEKTYMDDKLFEAFFEKNLYGQSWLSPQFIRRKKVIKEAYLDKGTLKYNDHETIYDNDIYVKLYRNDKVWVEPCSDLREAGYCVLEDDYNSLDAFKSDYCNDESTEEQKKIDEEEDKAEGEVEEEMGEPMIYKNLDYVKPGVWYYGDQGKINRGAPTLIDSMHKDRVVVLHFFHKYKDEYIIYANGVEIYHGKMPYDHGELPLIQFIDHYRPDSLYHKGETELCAGLFALTNAIFNTTIDALKYSIAPMLVIPTGSNFNQDEIVARPGMVIKANMDGFKQLELGRVPSEAISLRETLIDFIAWTTGVNIRQMLGEPASTTATVAALRKESLSRRINLGLRLNEARAFKRLGEQLVALVQQYYTEPMIERLVGEDKVKGLPGETPNENEKTEGVKKYRSIKVRGKGFKEVKNDDGYSLEMEKLDKNEYGFFQARPEYILTQTALDVIVRPGSTVAVSQLLEQNKAEKAIELALRLNPALQQQGEQPINLTFIVKKWLDTMKYDPEKALGKEQTDDESVQEIMSKNDMDKINTLGLDTRPEGATMPPNPGTSLPQQPPQPPGQPPQPSMALPAQSSGAAKIGQGMNNMLDLGI